MPRFYFLNYLKLNVHKGTINSSTLFEYDTYTPYYCKTELVHLLLK